MILSNTLQPSRGFSRECTTLERPYGMEKLIVENTLILPPEEHSTDTTSTFTATAKVVLNKYGNREAALNSRNLLLTGQRRKMKPTITTYRIRQSFGHIVTDSVLRTANGVDYKSIVDYHHVYKLVQVAIQGGDRPATCDILGHLINIIARRPTSQNCKDIQILLIILANIEVATPNKHGSEFKTALQTICH